MRGPVETINAPTSFTIQGITIDVSSVRDDNFEGSAGQSLGRDAFFNQLRSGAVVQATSDDGGSGCVNGTLTAREVEFEPADNVFFDDNENNLGAVLDN